MSIQELAKKEPRLLLNLVKDAERVIAASRNIRLNQKLRDQLFNLAATVKFVIQELDNAKKD